ncbi:sodium channel protein 1 brain-like isoform X2 [Lineus longissimus]|uniref:sodium channel protein 1 brain-like isoform X2 n=1 Tax=Lineus longissimus TaxID=88925 RepID=UPI002B4F5265
MGGKNSKKEEEDDEEGLVSYNPFTKESMTKVLLKEEEEKKKALDRLNKPKEGRLVDGELRFDDEDDDGDDVNLDKDPALVEGNVLPEAHYGTCPRDLLGKPLEEIDRFIKDRSFIVINTRIKKRYIYRFSATKGFFLFTPWNPLRKGCILIVTNEWFDYFIMLTILANCVFLALGNSSPAVAEYVFTAIYTAEMILKMLARGLIANKYTYLREGWNWLDFGVILLAYTTIILAETRVSGVGNLSGLRTLRVLRALKTISIFPGLKTIVNALLRSMKMFAEVLTLTTFCMMVFALFGLQVYMGVLRNKCVLNFDTTGLSNLSHVHQYYNSWIKNTTNWEMFDESYRVCGNISGAGGCATGYSCLPDIGENPDYGYTNFDHFGFAMLASFQLITLDFWENLYNYIIRASGPWNILFFIMVVFFGSFYLVNLMLAVVTMSYEEEALNDGKYRSEQKKEKKKAEKEEKEKEKQAKAKKKAKAQEKMKFDPKKLQAKIMKKKDDGDPSSATSTREKDPANKSQVSLKGKENGQVVGGGKAAPKDDGKKKKGKVSPVKQDSVQSNDTGVASSIGSINSTSKPDPKLRKLNKQNSLDIMGTKNSTPVDSGMGSTDRLIEELELTSQLGDEDKDEYDSDSEDDGDTHSIVVVDEYGMREDTEKEYKDRNCLKCKACCKCYFPWLKFQNAMYNFTMDPLFELFIILCIVLNTLCMAIVSHGMSEDLKSGLEYANYVFTGVFTIECIFKILAMPKLYWNNKWNIFDFFIVVVSLIDVSLQGINVPGLSVFRTVRLFRVFKLAQSWATMRLLLTIIFSALGSLGNLTFILALFMFIFAVMGMQLFQDYYTTAYFPEGVPRWNFTDFWHSLILIFRVLCGEWIEPLWDCMRAYNETCMVVFIPTLFIGNFMVLNLFLALLLNSFASDSLQKKEKETKQETSKFKAAFQRLKMILRIKKSISVEPEKKEEEDGGATSKDDEVEMLEITADGSAKTVDKKTANGHAGNKMSKSVEAFSVPREQYSEFGNTLEANKVSVDNADAVSRSKSKTSIRSKQSVRNEEKRKEMEKKMKMSEDENQETSGEIVVLDCFPLACTKRCKCCHCCDDAACMPNWVKFRKGMIRAVDHKVFEAIILILILGSSISLCFEDIYLEFDPTKQLVLQYLNYVFAILFTIEMLMKWAAYGYKKYFTSFWTILDFLIVLISWTSLIVDLLGGANISAFRALRTLRAFRPLRAISRWQGMRIVVNALMFAIPAIFNVLLVCLIFWLIFSIIGVQVFMGKFFKCIDTDGNRLDHTITPNKTVCIAKGYTWKNSYVNFDDAGQGFLALLQVATFEGWMEVMVDAIDATAIDVQPQREANFPAYIYFFIFIVFGSFFTLNLFIGVIIDNFNMLKKKYEGTYLDMFLTSNQKNYYNTLKKLGNKKPQKTIKRPRNKCQGFFFDLAISTKFELAIVILIFLNMIAMGVEHYKQSQVITDSLEIVNICFTTVFTLEAIIKIIGLRWHYFRRAWNVFDFIIVILSIVGVILDDLLKDVFITPTLLRVVRIFRIGRVLRLIKAAKGIRKLLFALIISIPALFNIGALLFLFLFIFAIVGMSSFGKVKHTGALNDLVNFETFERSMLLLFRLTTSAGWNDILDPLFIQPPDCDPEYYTNPVGVKVKVQNGDCGTPWLAAAYMIAFVFLTFLIIINMYIAVILENFNQAHEQEEVGVTEDDFDMFYVIWERFDPHATQYIKYEQLSDFVADLDEPLGIPKPNEIALVSFDLPIVKGDKIHCLDILIGLTRHVLGDVEASNEFKELRSQLEDKFKESFPTRISTDVVSSTIFRKKEDVAAKTLQRAWRRHKAEKTMRQITALAMEAAGKRPGSALSRRFSSQRSSLNASFNLPGTSKGKTGNKLTIPV